MNRLLDVIRPPIALNYCVNGIPVACGDTPAVYVFDTIVQNNLGNWVQRSPFTVPLIATLRAIGATVTESTDTSCDYVICYNGITWELSLGLNPSMRRQNGSSVELLSLHEVYGVGSIACTADGTDILVDNGLLTSRILYYMEGERMVWSFEKEFEFDLETDTLHLRSSD